MKIPRNDDGLRSFALNLVSKCDLNKTAWSIPAAAITSLQVLVSDYEAKLEVCESPDRRKSDTVAKNESKQALIEALQLFGGKYLEYNDAIQDADRVSLGLGLRDKIRTQVPRPDTSPVFYIEIRGARILAVHFKPEGAEGSARPYGYSGALIRYLITDADAPPPEGEDFLTKSRLATATPCVFEFAAEERGKKVWFALAWQLRRGGILGPFSEVQGEIIP